MNANRTLGLLAAILVTAVQATVLAVDTRSVPENDATPVHYDASLDNSRVAETRLAYRAPRAVTGG